MTSSFLLLFLFVALAAGLRWLASESPLQRVFGFLPVPFWCYMVPMLATTLGWLPQNHPLYDLLSHQMLPVCLALLLIDTDLKAIARLGGWALGLMAMGALGTMAGGLVSYLLYRKALPPDSWGAVGALTGSWIGGSANLVAVKEALNVPDALIAPIILTDAVLAYSWMALLVWGAGWQQRWDRIVAGSGWAGSAASRVRAGTESRNDSLAGTSEDECRSERNLAGVARTAHRWPAGTGQTLAILVLSVALSLAAQWAAQFLPASGRAFNAFTWTILLVTTASLLLSLTPLRRLCRAGGASLGTFLLLVLLASIGARGNLRAAFEAPAFLLMGLTWLAIHGAILLLFGYLWKAPLGLIATVSQANIGGTISAPIVGATYSRELAGVGLLMAVLGNVLGTYAGLLTASLAQWLAGSF